MTRDQMQRECDRLHGVLEAYEAQEGRPPAGDEAGDAAWEPGPERHAGLKLRIAELERKLADANRAY